MNKLSWQDALPDVKEATLETLYMVSFSLILAVIGGTLLGVTLTVLSPRGLSPHPLAYRILSTMVNTVRSLPFLVLLIVLIKFTRLIVGTSIGPEAAIVPLTIGSIPFFARIVDNALQEVPRGRIDAAVAAGATHRMIISKVLIPESATALIAGTTLTTIMLVGYSAMAGAIGGGGLGDFALVYGYQRFNTPVLVVAVIVLIVLVQIIQSTGDYAVRRRALRR